MRAHKFLSQGVLSLLLFARPSLSQPTWYPPNSTATNNLTQVIHGTGTNGFIYNSSTSHPYGTYNYCNMPHVRIQEYPHPKRPNSLQTPKLEYVEILHRHHKRTPYESNLFPNTHPGGGGKPTWDCSDIHTITFSESSSLSNKAAKVYTRFYTSPSNPFLPPAPPLSTCQFPQITTSGLQDSYQHGQDIYTLYHTHLSFLPATYSPSQIQIRTTSNPITSQVASALLSGMYGHNQLLAATSIPLYQQDTTIDSLRPGYPCPSADTLRANTITNPSTNPTWKSHLDLSIPLSQILEITSNVNKLQDNSWYTTWDHYFDNLSSHLCHGKPLPCNTETGTCISMAEAETIFRLGQWEYDFMYRSAGEQTLSYSRGHFGIFIAELAQRIESIAGKREKKDEVIYRHNVAHDGTVALFLSVLQVGEMVWPGLGAEIVFEIWSTSPVVVVADQGAQSNNKNGNGNGNGNGSGNGSGNSINKKYYVRILWGGKIMYSNALGWVDMLEVDKVLEYMTSVVSDDGSVDDVVKRCKA